MGTTMSVSDARAAMLDLIERVLAGDEVTLTRHGQAVAVVVRPDALRARRAEEAYAAAKQVRGVLERARTVPLRPRPTLQASRADELVAEVGRHRAGAGASTDAER